MNSFSSGVKVPFLSILFSTDKTESSCLSRYFFFDRQLREFQMKLFDLAATFLQQINYLRTKNQSQYFDTCNRLIF